MVPSTSLDLAIFRFTITLDELASQYELHPSQISEWKSQLLKEGASVFSTTVTRQQKEQEALQADLYEQIGRLQMELEWLKKSCPVTPKRNVR